MNEKQCANCIHFAEHYVICRRMLLKTGTGHCRLRKKQLKMCTRWALVNDKEEISLEAIQKIIKATHKRIDNIAYILDNLYKNKS